MVKPIKESSRFELVHEFREVFKRAHEEGDRRPPMVILNEWLKFREETINARQEGEEAQTSGD